MTMSDPRLADLALLSLAAMRARRRQQVPDWPSTHGLAALLEAARALPEREPWSLPSVKDGSGLARLLEEARQRQQEGAGGA